VKVGGAAGSIPGRPLQVSKQTLIESNLPFEQVHRFRFWLSSPLWSYLDSRAVRPMQSTQSSTYNFSHSPLHFLASVLLLLAVTLPAKSAPLSDPSVDNYNVHVGTQTFAGLYRFTTNTLLVETAQAIQNLGSGVIKGYLGPDLPRQYYINLPSGVTNLLTLVRDEPSWHFVLDMPFRDFVLWAYPFGKAWPFDGYSASERADDYQELHDLTRYLLTNYNNSGKTFYLGHWEGDWYLLPNYDTTTNPSPVAIQGMVDWLNNRQQAVDDAKRDTAFTNVNVFCYAEVNRVRDAMSDNTNINQRAINKVIPYVTNLDCLSWSSYDGMDLNSSDLTATLGYMASQLPTNKAAVVPGQRIWIGEYGWGGLPTAQQEPRSRSYIQRLLPWGPRFILFWEIYNNETNNNFCLIDSNNVKVASYYLHQRFINSARLLTARFKETNGRLPNDTEFASLLTPILSQPLPSPVSLSLANGPATNVRETSATISGTLTQGLYGGDQATVWVFWGRQDGGTNRNAWEHGLNVGLNTNFNPATFSAALTNLIPQTNYFFRFYATNATGEGWAPASASFFTVTLNPLNYGSHMKVVFDGYDRSELLLNFPVLVELGTNLPGFAYNQFASRQGGDLRFTDSAGSALLPYEIDEWNTNGTSSVWVRVPRLTGTNDSIWAFWGNPLDTNPLSWTTNGQMWSSDHYLVWHLKESGFPYTDGARRHPALSGVAPASTGGVVGRGASFDGSSRFLDAGQIDLGDAFTLSAWVNVAPAANDIQTVWANQPGGFGSPGFAFFVNTYLTNDRKLDFASGDGTNGNEAQTVSGAVTFGEWHMLAASVDRENSTVEFFVDGAHIQSGTVIADFENQADVNLGRFTNGFYYFNGQMDEVRIAAGTQSSDWVWANWMTVASNAAFAAYSSVTQQVPTLSLVLSSTNLLLSWPASAIGFSLYTTTNLTPPATWTRVLTPPTLLGNRWQIALALSATATTHFFRLQ
jgi:hypothetical protein